MSYFAIYYDTQKKRKSQYMMEYFLPRIEHFIYFEIMKYLDTSVRT